MSAAGCCRKVRLKMSSNADNRPFWKVVASLLLSLAVTVGVVFLGIRFLIFFMPFVVGWFISYIAAPLVNFLEKRLKIVKKLGSAIIIVVVLGGIIVALYFAFSKVWKELNALITNLPAIYDTAEHVITNLAQSLKDLIPNLPEAIQPTLRNLFENIGSVGVEFVQNLGTPTITWAGNFAKSIPSVLISFIITTMSAYFFIAEREEIIAWSKKVAPAALTERVSLVVANMKIAVGGYFKAQFKIMAVIFVILLAGFLILRVPLAALLALLIALLDFLPFFGTGTALIPWAVYKLITQDFKMAIGLLILYAVTQVVRQLIQPKLVGDSMGLDPLMTLFLLFIGYRLGGVLGMILAVPLGMIIINLYRSGGFDYILDDVKLIIKKLKTLRE